MKEMNKCKSATIVDFLGKNIKILSEKLNVDTGILEHLIKKQSMKFSLFSIC